MSVTASVNGALVHAYTRLPVACASATASASLANGVAIFPSPGAVASAWANTPQSSTTFVLLGSPEQSGLLPPVPPSCPPCRRRPCPCCWVPLPLLLLPVASAGSVSGRK